MSISISIDGSVVDVIECTAELCSTDNAILGYVPSLSGNLAITSIFGAFLIAHAICWFFYRTHSFTLAILLGLALETVGYLARVQLHTYFAASTPFLVNTICLAVAPLFFMATLHVTYCRVIMHYGPQNSRLTPRQHILFFILFNAIALILQTVGSALADTKSTKTSSSIMATGFILQLISLLLFIVLAAEFLVRSGRERTTLRNLSWAKGMIEGPNPDSRVFKFFLSALILTTLLILLRTAFRTLLSFSLFNTEAPFIALESSTMILAAFLLNLFHPGRYIGEQWKESGWGVESKPSLTLDLDKEVETPRPSDVFMRPWPFGGEGDNYGDERSIYGINSRAS